MAWFSALDIAWVLWDQAQLSTMQDASASHQGYGPCQQLDDPANQPEAELLGLCPALAHAAVTQTTAPKLHMALGCVSLLETLSDRECFLQHMQWVGHPNNHRSFNMHVPALITGGCSFMVV